LFQDIQVAITDTDIILVKERDVRQADDFLWRELFITQRAIARKLTDEQIEIAYADLFGYDTKIHELFGALVQRLAKVDRKMFTALLKRSQDDILSSYREDGNYVSTVLGNRLRMTAKETRVQCARLMEAALAEFRKEMVKIVIATDEEIARKNVAIRDPSEVFAGFHEIAELLSSNEKPTVARDGKKLRSEERPSYVDRDADPPISSLPPPSSLTPPSRGGDGDDEDWQVGRSDRDPGIPVVAQEAGPLVVQGLATGTGDRKSSPRGRKQPRAKERPSYGDRDPNPPISPPPSPSSATPPPRGGYEDDED
jgi:hypothetical protein